MRTITLSDPKCASLRAYGSLNPHPERVSDALFQAYPFFDPRDVVQVKYEMLRRIRVTGQPVGRTASAFGYSRVRLAQLRQRFAEAGMVGLLPQGKGPRRQCARTRSARVPAAPSRYPDCGKNDRQPGYDRWGQYNQARF